VGLPRGGRLRAKLRARCAVYVSGCEFESVNKEKIMGFFEEVAGAVVAVEGLKKVDPDAGIVTEGIAAVAGFEGVEAVTNYLEKKKEESE
jgi:hypothetical protein